MDEHSNNQVDKLFRDSLQSHRDESSLNLWDKIENQLDEEDSRLSKTGIRKRFWITACILLFISGSATFILFNSESNKNTSALAIEKKKDLPVIPKNGQAKQVHTGSPVLNSVENNKPPRKNDLNSGSTGSSQMESSDFQYLTAGTLNDPGINEVTVSDLHPLNMEPPDSELYIQTGKRDFSLKPNIPASLIIHPEKHSVINHFSVTPYFSQEFAGYNLSDDDATAADGQEIENKERNVFSASVGFYLNYKINKRWVIQSGISYSWSSSIIDSTKSFAVEDNSGNVQFKLNTISGYGYLQTTSPLQPAVGDSVLTAKSKSQLHYLTIPLILSYKIPLNRFSLLVGAGISVNFLTGASVETEIYGSNFKEDESTIPIKGLKNINFGIIIKADLEYHINSTWGINLIPSFKNSLTPINILSALSAYPYNFGIGAGISYKF